MTPVDTAAVKKHLTRSSGLIAQSWATVKHKGEGRMQPLRAAKLTKNGLFQKCEAGLLFTGNPEIGNPTGRRIVAKSCPGARTSVELMRHAVGDPRVARGGKVYSCLIQSSVFMTLLNRICCVTKIARCNSSSEYCSRGVLDCQCAGSIGKKLHSEAEVRCLTCSRVATHLGHVASNNHRLYTSRA